jgi:hypothetical protein
VTMNRAGGYDVDREGASPLPLRRHSRRIHPAARRVARFSTRRALAG